MKLVCKICNKEFSSLGMHIVSIHKISCKEYKQKYNVDCLICKEQTEKRRKVLKEGFISGRIKPSGCASIGKDNYVNKVGLVGCAQIGENNYSRTHTPTFLGRRHTIESKKKIGDSNSNPSELTRQKMRDAKIGKKPWNIGLTKENDVRVKKNGKNSVIGKKINGVRYDLENNPNWQGGLSFIPYTEEFNNKLKRLIRKRDNYVCMLCRIHQEKLSYALSIHHINYNKKLSIPQNCISLCKKCHSIVNFNRKKWVQFFQSLLIENYNYKYNENTEVIINIK